MSLGIGIVGLPNVGKSTIFNALTREQSAQAANYPFCTIEPNKAIVPVPDSRLDKLAAIVNPKQIVNATVEFVDIAGLVRGASKGEGLGNQFLGNIRETAAILHVARCFEDPDIIHVDGTVDPIRDAEVIELELIIADDQTLQRRIDTLTKKSRTDKAAKAALEVCDRLRAHFATGKPAIAFPERASDLAHEALDDLSLLTDKRVIFCANVDEAGLAEDNTHVKRLREYAAARDSLVVKICARVEEELGGMSEAERAEFLASYGVTESGLDQVIHQGYATLGLISYFTAGPLEAKAWTIKRGWKAPKSASVIHTDFEKGFIRAEVIGYDDYVKYNGEAGARSAGAFRVEGKEYVVQDGDVMHFRFNV